VHNIGSAAAPATDVAVLDEEGKVVARRSMATLPAPLDLHPRRRSFSITIPKGDQRSWRLMIDPEDRIPEIFEENNSVSGIR
jgi:hypothetical protein